MAQTEHMPWIWAVNPDYVEVCNISSLPKDPVGGQVLDPIPKPSAFAASVYPVASLATPITSPVLAGMRCTMLQHDGAHVAVRRTQPQVALRRAASFYSATSSSKNSCVFSSPRNQESNYQVQVNSIY